MIQIPFLPSVSGDQVFRIELAAQLVVFRLTWNPRTEYWHFSLEDEFGGRIDGIKIVKNWPLLKQAKGSLDFFGDLIVLPLDATAGERVGYDDLGSRFGFFYMSSVETQEWEAANGVG